MKEVTINKPGDVVDFETPREEVFEHIVFNLAEKMSDKEIKMFIDLVRNGYFGEKIYESFLLQFECMTGKYFEIPHALFLDWARKYVLETIKRRQTEGKEKLNILIMSHEET